VTNAYVLGHALRLRAIDDTQVEFHPPTLNSEEIPRIFWSRGAKRTRFGRRSFRGGDCKPGLVLTIEDNLVGLRIRGHQLCQFGGSFRESRTIYDDTDGADDADEVAEVAGSWGKSGNVEGSHAKSRQEAQEAPTSWSRVNSNSNTQG